MVIVGGAALVLSAFMYWVSHGTGSGLRGHALIDAVVAAGRDLPGASAGRLTVVWYLVPALGAASWISLGLFGAGSRSSRVIAAAAAVAVVAAAAAFVRLVGFSNLGSGVWIALAGAAAVIVGSWVIAPKPGAP